MKRTLLILGFTCLFALGAIAGIIADRRLHARAPAPRDALAWSSLLQDRLTERLRLDAAQRDALAPLARSAGSELERLHRVHLGDRQAVLLQVQAGIEPILTAPQRAALADLIRRAAPVPP